MRLARRALLAAPLALGLAPAIAQDNWPNRTIRIVVPFAPGGSGDITARLVGKHIEDKTGQPVVVENKPGANGLIGVAAAKTAPPDGYTLLLATTSTHAANPSLYKNPGYDPQKDFQLVGVIGGSGTALVVSADSPYRKLEDLIADAKARPGKLFFGHFNASSHVPSEVLAERAGVQWTAVAYRAIGNAWNDLFAGNIQFFFVDLTASRGHIVAGKVRPLAISLEERHPLYPAVPTVAEFHPGFNTSGMLALAVPAGTPPAVAQRLNDLINEAILSPAIAPKLDDFGLRVRRHTLAEADERGRVERAKWAEYIRIARIEPQ